ncbi:hypothetical protein OHB00_22390 [Streptomyces sp. NBC_00631]|uniref:hypothetical protein n=1 Tax=Streptomyces sp. NBC_00631 TaxID=2975793 RepID=UPI0030E3BB38
MTSDERNRTGRLADLVRVRAGSWRMFDGDLTTATTSGNGWVTVSPTDGSSLTLDAVPAAARRGKPSWRSAT